MKLKKFISKTKNFVKRSRCCKIYNHRLTKKKGGALYKNKTSYIRPIKKVGKLKRSANFLYRHKGKILSLAAMAMLAHRGSKVDVDNLIPANKIDMQYGLPNFDDVFDRY